MFLCFFFIIPIYSVEGFYVVKLNSQTLSCLPICVHVIIPAVNVFYLFYANVFCSWSKFFRFYMIDQSFSL